VAKDAYYFKHDAHARHDPKIVALIKKYGLEGYGRFWVVIEMLREDSTYKLEEKKYIWGALADQFKCEPDEAKKFIDDCVIEFELFIREEGFFYSASLLGRMVKLDEIRLKRSIAGKMGAAAREHIDD